MILQYHNMRKPELIQFLISSHLISVRLSGSVSSFHIETTKKASKWGMRQSLEPCELLVMEICQSKRWATLPPAGVADSSYQVDIICNVLPSLAILSWDEMMDFTRSGRCREISTT